MLDAKAYEASSIKKNLNDVENILKEYLPTLRDAKIFGSSDITSDATVVSEYKRRAK
jgi:hypothetical protein